MTDKRPIIKVSRPEDLELIQDGAFFPLPEGVNAKNPLRLMWKRDELIEKLEESIDLVDSRLEQTGFFAEYEREDAEILLEHMLELMEWLQAYPSDQVFLAVYPVAQLETVE
jgi:hypothetical protein